MFIGKVKGIVQQLLQRIVAYHFITYVYPAIKLRKIDIYPPGVLGLIAKKGAVFYYVGVGGVLKCIRIAWLIEQLIFFLWKIYFEIAGWLGGVG